jgi:colanic acid/amylovoran biosynthesis protein
MRIIIDPSTLDCLNMGDVAMLQVAVRRLRRKLPGASIQVLTNDPVELARLCPHAKPLAVAGRALWFSDRGLLGRLQRYLPGWGARAMIALQSWLRRHVPGIYRALLLARMYLTRTDNTDFRAFTAAFEQTDLYLVSGAATINDKARVFARMVLGTIDMALRRRIPVVLCSQGIGPLNNPELLNEARRILPRASLIFLRERLYGPRVLDACGIESQKVSVTGDDAVELAYEGRTNRYGDGIGVNLRVGRSSDVDSSVIPKLSRILQAAAQVHNASLIPLPIALHAAADDARVIHQLLKGDASQLDSASLLDEPRKLIAATSGCRIVVTGAYHAAVFALAQGIPAVCLVGNANYREKFNGLADQFGSSCELVELYEARMAKQLMAAIERAWRDSTQTRPTLLTAAVRQIEASQNAYQRIADLLRHTAPTGYSFLRPSSSHS